MTFPAAELQRLLDENAELQLRVQELQAEVDELEPTEIGVEDYLSLRYADDPIEAFNLFIRQWVAPRFRAHLLDDDDNPGQYVRNAIAARIEEHGWDHKDDNPGVIDELEVGRIAALIYEHRWYGVPGQNLGRCNCHWDNPDAPGEITYSEHTRHVADAIIHADTGTGEGER